MRWAEPVWLFFLILAPLPWLFDRARPKLAWPSLDFFPKKGSARTVARRTLLLALRSFAIVALVIALARPQTVGGRTHVAGQGVAIVVVLDQSSSMNTADFPSEKGAISRLDAARNTVTQFVTGRSDDLLGLVVFANYPDIACPPTLDHAFLLETVRSIRSARPGDDGTNLGDAIVLSLDALRVTTPKKKVLILLTDGRNSPAVPHPIDPRVAALLARDLGVTVHTIAIGRPDTRDQAATTRKDADGSENFDAPDFELLKSIATIGTGRAFSAANTHDLEAVFQTIDTLEKSPVQSMIRTRYREHYAPWVALAIGLLTLDRLFSTSSLRRLP